MFLQYNMGIALNAGQELSKILSSKALPKRALLAQN
jgi:hypothetical protein